MEIRIRKATECDIDGILRLLRQVNDIHAEGRPDLFLQGHTKYDSDGLRMILRDPESPVFVGIDPEGNLAGYCFCIIEDHSQSNNLTPIKTLYIDDLCVDEAYRGKHVGRNIFNAVTTYARKNGFYNITLNVWCCNPGAMKFYESLGMQPMKIAMETVLS